MYMVHACTRIDKCTHPYIVQYKPFQFAVLVEPVELAAAVVVEVRDFSASERSRPASRH